MRPTGWRHGSRSTRAGSADTDHGSLGRVAPRNFQALYHGVGLDARRKEGASSQLLGSQGTVSSC